LGLAAARQVDGQDYRLVIAGEIPDSLLQQVRQMATQCKLPERAVHFTGAVTDGVLNVLYHSATALLNPSRYEGLTLSILHAMTAGLPVIAGNNSAQAESFEGAARMVDADSTDSIARAIMDIHTQPELRETLIQSGKRYSSRFTWRKTAEKTAMYLSESMLQRKRETSPSRRVETVARSA
ncbi:MAG: glycosyltransferase, partial [Calditrichota bacterium]